MNNRDVKDYLQDIIDTINITEKFIIDFDFLKFEDDQKTIFAVTRSIEIIGEASKQIPQSIKDNYPEVPWKEIAGMRDKVIHQYFGINIKILWNTARQELPQLKPKIQKILNEIGK